MKLGDVLKKLNNSIKKNRERKSYSNNRLVTELLKDVPKFTQDVTPTIFHYSGELFSLDRCLLMGDPFIVDRVKKQILKDKQFRNKVAGIKKIINKS